MQEESYLTSYFKLIRAALSEDRNKGGETYYEAHHIIPKCTKKASTLVLLKAREHYAAHWYLMKHFDNHTAYGEKMKWAFHACAYWNGKYLTVSEYEQAREALMPLWQRAKSPEHRRAIGDAHKLKRYVRHPETQEVRCIDKEELQAFIDAGWENSNWTKGVKRSAETRAKLSAVGTRIRTGKRGSQATASKGPYSVQYQDGRVVTADSMLLLSEESGIKHQSLYWRLRNRKGLIINGYGVFEGTLTV